MTTSLCAAIAVATLTNLFGVEAQAQARRWTPIAELPYRATAIEILTGTTFLVATIDVLPDRSRPALHLYDGGTLVWTMEFDTVPLPYFDYPHGLIQDIHPLSDDEVLLAFQYGHARRVNLRDRTSSELALVPVGGFAETANGTILAGTRFRTTNDGVTWETIEEASRPPEEMRAVMGSGNGTFFGTTFYSGLWKSRDDGRTWSEASALRATTDSLTGAGNPLFVFDERTVIISSGNLRSELDRKIGLYKTSDGGDSWRRVLPMDDVHGSVMYAQSGEVAFAGLDPGLRDFHMYTTTDAGETWTVVDDGFPATLTPGVMAMKGTTVLAYVSTIGPETMYRLEAASAVSDESTERALGSVRLWPNPARGEAMITFTSSRATSLKVVVTNLLGQTVLQEAWILTKAGEDIRSLDVSSLRPGTYWMSLRDAEGNVGSPHGFVKE